MSTVTDDHLERLTQVTRADSERLRKEIKELNREMEKRFTEVPTRHELGLKFDSLTYRLNLSDIILGLIWFVVLITAVRVAETH